MEDMGWEKEKSIILADSTINRIICNHVDVSDNQLLKLSVVKSPSVSPPIYSAFAPYPLFQWYPWSNEILLNLGMKRWNSAFNAQGSQVIIVIVQVGAVKIYVARVQALRRKETRDES